MTCEYHTPRGGSDRHETPHGMYLLLPGLLAGQIANCKTFALRTHSGDVICENEISP